VGLVPAYTVADANGAFEVTDWLTIRVGVNNLFDAQYFTKRPQFYPGPGVWPSDARSLQLSVDLSSWR
jgi:Fe(3+) dicitrate transport protein